MKPPIWSRFVLLVMALGPTLATGCTSALTSAYLRSMPWDMPEHAAEKEPAAESGGEGQAPDEQTAAAEPSDGDDDRRAAAIDEAVTRLTKLGTLDEAAASTLVTTLRGTQQEDWPVVIAEFAAALSAAAPVSDTMAADLAAEAVEPPAESEAEPMVSHVVAKAELAPPAPAPSVAAADPTPLSPADPAPPRIQDAPSAAAPSAPAELAAAQAERAGDAADEPPTGEATASPGFRITNACFASRVQAWGVVDRFPLDRFRAGREVIVYFELDNLSAQATGGGHTTCIDTMLRLVNADGRTLHEWNFEPLAETCAGRRHDYFARYVVRIPADLPPGDCRLQVLVTDTLAGAAADASLPLEILAPVRPDAG